MLKAWLTSSHTASRWDQSDEWPARESDPRRQWKHPDGGGCSKSRTTGDLVGDEPRVRLAEGWKATRIMFNRGLSDVQICIFVWCQPPSSLDCTRGIMDCLLIPSLCSFCPVMRWLPVRTAKTVKTRKRRRLIVWTVVFEAFKVFACSRRWQAVLSGGRGWASTIFYNDGGQEEDHRPWQWRRVGGGRPTHHRVSTKRVATWRYCTFSKTWSVSLHPNASLVEFGSCMRASFLLTTTWLRDTRVFSPQKC